MYDYQTQRPNLFTNEGQKLFLKIRDRTHALINQGGAARMQEIMRGSSGSTWDMLASVDRLVELGEIHEITGPGVAGQHRVFVSCADRNT